MLERRRRTRKEIFSFAVEADILESLYHIAAEKGMNLSQIGRQALRDWLIKEGYLESGNNTQIRMRSSLALTNDTDTTDLDSAEDKDQGDKPLPPAAFISSPLQAVKVEREEFVPSGREVDEALLANELARLED